MGILRSQPTACGQNLWGQGPHSVLTILPGGSEALVRLITKDTGPQSQLHVGTTWEDQQRKCLGHQRVSRCGRGTGMSEAPQVTVMCSQD